MIYQTIDFNSFQRAFINAGRESQFTYTGLRMLFDYIEELSNDTGQDIELDVIALCCQYAEYTLEEFLGDYPLDDVDSIEDLEQALLDGSIDCVINFHLWKDSILVNNNY